VQLKAWKRKAQTTPSVKVITAAINGNAVPIVGPPTEDAKAPVQIPRRRDRADQAAPREVLQECPAIDRRSRTQNDQARAVSKIMWQIHSSIVAATLAATVVAIITRCVHCANFTHRRLIAKRCYVYLLTKLRF